MVTAMEQARVRLQALLDEINDGGTATRTLEAFLVDLLDGTPQSFTRPVTIVRDGATLRFTAGSTQPFWTLVNLLMQVGLDRVRRCPFTWTEESGERKTCNRWFVGAKGQRFHNYEHAQRDRDRRKSEQRKGTK
jgi:hypothetical protein